MARGVHAFQERAKRRELRQRFVVDRLRIALQKLAPGVRDDKAAAARRRQEASAREVELRPVQPVRQNALTAAGQDLFALLAGKEELLADQGLDLRHAGFALGGGLEKGEHELLIVGYGHLRARGNGRTAYTPFKGRVLAQSSMRDCIGSVFPN